MNICLKIARIKAGMTQAELAKKVGVTTRYISSIESKGNKPSPKVMEKISDVLDVTVQELFFRR
ncbi:MAG: helix-turn-helix domain-containing protein [Ruminococcus flavefaciens]|nr:helix-turn-helix domain-containing protein [Ruminococcus flavefaciens]